MNLEDDDLQADTEAVPTNEELNGLVLRLCCLLLGVCRGGCACARAPVSLCAEWFKDDDNPLGETDDQYQELLEQELNKRSQPVSVRACVLTCILD